jgi:ribosome-associated heat shock protein Hsp15
MAGDARQRIDKWLFFARVVKSRSLAAKLVESEAVRVNRDKVGQPSHQLKVGDVLTIKLGLRVLVYRVAAPGTRRGPPAEARTLYEDLSLGPDGSGPSVAGSGQSAG